jgi:nucleotide-binding universal stress UspA family protein
MKTILVPVDFSDLTLKLVKAAIHLAKPFHSKIIVLHVSDEADQALPVGSGPDVLPPPPPLEEMSAHAFNEGLTRLKEMVTSVGLDGTTVELHGPAVELILAQAESSHVDLIVLGSHSRGLIYHLLVGSVVGGVLKRARCPVLIVPVHDESS